MVNLDKKYRHPHERAFLILDDKEYNAQKAYAKSLGLSWSEWARRILAHERKRQESLF